MFKCLDFSVKAKTHLKLEESGQRKNGLLKNAQRPPKPEVMDETKAEGQGVVERHREEPVLFMRFGQLENCLLKKLYKSSTMKEGERDKTKIVVLIPAYWVTVRIQ